MQAVSVSRTVILHIRRANHAAIKVVAVCRTRLDALA